MATCEAAVHARAHQLHQLQSCMQAVPIAQCTEQPRPATPPGRQSKGADARVPLQMRAPQPQSPRKTRKTAWQKDPGRTLCASRTLRSMWTSSRDCSRDCRSAIGWAATRLRVRIVREIPRLARLRRIYEGPRALDPPRTLWDQPLKSAPDESEKYISIVNIYIK